jgi:hypothetical protein
MKNAKKTYESPRLTVHGTVGELTLTGGGSSTDVPNGTPVGPSGIDSITGS